MEEGFLVQERIPTKKDIQTKEGILEEITLTTSHLMAMLRNRTRAFVMKPRDNKAFRERDIARVEFQQATLSQKFLANNPVWNLLILGCPSCLPQCIANLLQASTYRLLLQSPLPAPNSTPPEALQLLLAHHWCPHLPHHLHPHLPHTLAASHRSPSLGWAQETLEGDLEGRLVRMKGQAALKGEVWGYGMTSMLPKPLSQWRIGEM